MTLDHATDDSFGPIVLGSNKPVLVDFFASWCAPCRQMEPVLAALADEFSDKIQIVKVDADSNPETVLKYGIRSLPTMHLFKRGSIVSTFIGAKPRSVLAREISSHLQE